LEDLDIEGRIILNRIFEKYNGRTWFKWLKIIPWGMVRRRGGETEIERCVNL